ncbi:MAG TPA: hypothetical protein VGD40_01025 [Chryseosolibacter sp.]
MPLERASKETLRYLLTEYLKGPAVPYNITAVARRHNILPGALSDYMMEQGWIRDRWLYQNGDVTCRITIKGIEEIDPAYVRTKLRQVIGGLGEAGGRKQLTELLEIKISEYSITMDIVKQLDGLGFIRIHHPENTIVIELTEAGWKYYEKGSRTFFTLMSY